VEAADEIWSDSQVEIVDGHRVLGLLYHLCHRVLFRQEIQRDGLDTSHPSCVLLADYQQSADIRVPTDYHQAAQVVAVSSSEQEPKSLLCYRRLLLLNAAHPATTTNKQTN